MSKIKGYTPYSSLQEELVNRNKELEEQVLRVYDTLKEYAFVDQRDLALARTYLENSFMRANRAIFRPTRISLPGDETNV